MATDRRAVDEEIARWCTAHHGVVSRTQALAAGLTAWQVRHRVRSGRWDELRPGVYRIAGGVPSPLEPLAGAVAAGIGVASHLSAAALHELIDQHPIVPELTSDVTTGHHHKGVRLHRTEDLLPGDVTVVDGLRVTDVVRTLIDLGARLNPSELHRLVDKALRRELVEIDELIARFLQLAGRGRDGIATTRVVLERLDPSLAPAESDLETLTLEVIRSGGLPIPVRQHPVVVFGWSYRLDLAYPDLKIAIEADGFAVHGGRDAFESDRARQNRLSAAGWLVLRFTWRQICEQPGLVCRTIREAIQLRSRS
jgi:very-short-patch-repair endonuclease